MPGIPGIRHDRQMRSAERPLPVPIRIRPDPEGIRAVEGTCGQGEEPARGGQALFIAPGSAQVKNEIGGIEGRERSTPGR